MRVLIDTNIILDFLLQREPYFSEVELLFQAIDSAHITGYVTATTLTDIFYIARRRTRSIEQARQAISAILTVMVICPVNLPKAAFTSNWEDFEDAVQVACALAQGLDALVTRDKAFGNTSIPVLSVGEVLQQLGPTD